jgi:4-amino-4-deoxy-L-arabinose transferase-like glycosyltransferase
MKSAARSMATSNPGAYSEIILFCAALVLLFLFLGSTELYGSEQRWAEVTREMFLSGDFFHPKINGQLYYDKPLLGYWVIALLSFLSGTLNEWTVRIPAAVSGLIGLGATVFIGRKLWSREVGLNAGWLLLTTYGFLMWSRCGQTEMANMASATLAVAWYWARRDQLSFGSYFVFYVICFVGALNKGLTAAVVPLLAVFPDLIRQGRWRTHLKPAQFLALGLAVAIYLAPFVYSAQSGSGYQSSGLGLVFRENIQRYFKPFDHREPVYIYFYALPLLFLPWAPLLALATSRIIIRYKRLDDATRWLIETFALIFLFFTCSGSRREYYILPILPFCALLSAVFLSTAEREARWLRIALCTQIFVLASAVGAALVSPLLWPRIKALSGFVPPKEIVWFTPVIALLAGGAWTINRRSNGLVLRRLGLHPGIASLVITALLLLGSFFTWQWTALGIYRTQKPFGQELKKLTADIAPKNIAFFARVPPRIIFYAKLSVPVQELQNADMVRRFLDSDTDAKVLAARPAEFDQFLDALPPDIRNRPALTETIYPWEDKIRDKKMVAWKIVPQRDGGRNSKEVPKVN